MENKKRIKILVAEDVESNFLYLQAVLTKIDADVIWAQNGAESIEICSRMNDIDIVLMDLRMPILDGYEATKVLKQKFPNMPIIAQTAFAMADDREKAIAAGCDGYIAKPISASDLLTIILKYNP